MVSATFSAACTTHTLPTQQLRPATLFPPPRVCLFVCAVVPDRWCRLATKFPIADGWVRCFLGFAPNVAFFVLVIVGTRRAYFWLPEDEYIGSKPRRGTRESFIDRSIAFVHRMYQFEDGMSGTRRHASESFNVDGFCTYFWFCPEKIDAPLLGLVTVCTGLTRTSSFGLPVAQGVGAQLWMVACFCENLLFSQRSSTFQNIHGSPSSLNQAHSSPKEKWKKYRTYTQTTYPSRAKTQKGYHH